MFKSKIIDPSFSRDENWKRICEARGLDPVECLPQISGVPERHQLFAVSSVVLAIATETINEEHTPGWFANYSDVNDKQEPWFWIDGTENKPRGAGFSRSGYGRRRSSSGCGSRLSSPLHSGVTELIQECFRIDCENVWIIPS